MSIQGIKLLSKIRYSTRLVTTSLLVVALTIGLLVRVLLEIDENVKFRSSEVDGTVYLKALHNMSRLVQEHWVMGSTPNPQAEELPRAIEQAIQELDALDVTYGVRFQTSVPWAKIKEKWSRLGVAVPEGELSVHEDVLDDLAALSVEVADLSNLQLDRDLDTYYFSVCAYHSIPAITLHLSEARRALQNKLDRPPSHLFVEFEKKLRRDYGVAFAATPEAVPQLKPFLDRATADAKQFLNATKTRTPGDEAAFNQLMRDTQSSYETLRDATSQVLVRRLQQRVTTDLRAQRIIGVVTTVALATLISLFVSLYMAIAQAITRLRQTSAKLAVTQKTSALIESGDERNEVINAIELLASTVEKHSALQEREIERARKAEAAVREATTHVRQILDTTLDAVIGMDSSGVVIEWNHQAEVIFEWTAEEAIGMPVAKLIIPEALRAQHEAGLQRFVETGKGSIINTRIEITALKKSGKELTVELAITPLKVGTKVHFNAFVFDITERKRSADLLAAKETAEAANRAKSEFLTTMSHEIRTPMNGVLGMTSLLLDTPLTAEQRGFAETIRQSGDYLLTIINDILDFSKIEAGKFHLDSTAFDLRVITEEALDLLAELAAAKNLELVCFFPLEVPTRVIGDPGRIRQILLNLIGNAIKFTHQGEVVLRVRATEVSDARLDVLFEITDTGIGIDEEGQKRLFRVFSQVDSTTTRDYGGTGLGLVISQRLTQLMGGQIGVRSERQKGSTFYFGLPLQREAGVRSSPSRPSREVCQLKVLVADDNATTCEVLHSYLGAWGIEAVFVTSGQACLDMMAQEAARSRPFDVVFVDVQLPGIQLVDAARKSPEDTLFSKVRMVFLASPGRSNDKFAASSNTKVDAYLTKPLYAAQIKDCLQLVAEQKANAVPSSESVVSSSLSLQPLPDAGTRTALPILVAEDNQINQRIIVRMLEQLGFKSEVVENGIEALGALEKGTYAAVLLDCLMPKMDGYDVARNVRKREAGLRHYEHLPIIAVTANALAGDRERCLSAGMDDYVSKPLKRDALEVVLRKWIDVSDENMKGRLG